MSTGFRVEPSIDGTRIHARRPGRSDPGMGVVKLALVLLAWAAISYGLGLDPAQGYLQTIGLALAGSGGILLPTGLILRRLQPPAPEEYEILLDARGVSVDGQRMAHDVKMTLHAEKLVFRDAERQIEVWHGVDDLDERMELRRILERALEVSGERHGEGAAAVPEQLRERQREG